ncbi:MAG: hypothetical protein ACI8RZ_006019 [Myxococcota bacterium]|jgi:hypothetical protein
MIKPLLLTALLLSGCDELGEDTEVSVGVLSECPEGTPADAVWVDSASISGDQLTVDLSFGGGCETHDLGLCWDGSVAESDPAQVWLTVAHDAHNDSCEALLSESLTVDISELQVAGTPVTVHLDGWSDSLSYAW